jgi:hypothetical protein
MRRVLRPDRLDAEAARPREHQPPHDDVLRAEVPIHPIELAAGGRMKIVHAIETDHEPVLGEDSDADGWYCESCGADLDLVEE